MKKICVLLLISFSAWSQPAITLSERLQNYYEHRKPLIIHLHFNQPAYAPGDTAYFRVALLDVTSMLPIKDFQLIYLDLVDEKGETILHQEFRIRDGWGANQLAIPASLKPALYRVFVYNNWMKNFGKDFFFTSELHVAGSQPLQRGNRQGTLQIKAEGGTLVAGLQNRLIIAGPVKGTITIEDKDRRILLTQKSDSSGITSVIFTPPSAGQYTVVSAGSSASIRAENDGVVLRLLPAISSNGTHRLILSVPEQSALRNEELQVLISHHNLLSVSASVKFTDRNTAVLALPASTLPEGINYLCLNNLRGETLATRVFYNPPPDKVRCTITVDSSMSGTRQKKTVKLRLTDPDNNPLQARLSVSVYNQELFTSRTVYQLSIDQYIRWARDLSLPEGIGFTFSDNLFILSEWPWYRWSDVLSPLPKNNHLFTDYQQLHGIVINRNTGQPIRDSLQISFLVMRTNDFYEISTDKDGAFSLSFLFPFNYESDVFYRIEKNGRKISEAELKIEPSTYTYPAAPYTVLPAKGPDNYDKYNRLYREVTESYRYFGHKAVASKDVPHSALEKELGDADVTIDLDDYVLFPTMAETLHEIIPYLQYRKAGGRETVRMYLPELARSGTESPLFIIDGMLTDDADFFLRLSPADVDKIKIYYTQFKTNKLGSMSRNGVVIVETKLPGYAEKVAASARTLKMIGLSPGLPFPQKPEIWQENNPRAPRLRSTLYFNPYIRLNDNGEALFTFTTTDDTGTFVIHIEGLTTDGIPFTAQKTFMVKYQAN